MIKYDQLWSTMINYETIKVMVDSSFLTVVWQIVYFHLAWHACSDPTFFLTRADEYTGYNKAKHWLNQKEILISISFHPQISASDFVQFLSAPLKDEKVTYYYWLHVVATVI